MKQNSKATYPDDEWQEFLETMRVLHRRVDSLASQLDAIPEEARNSPEAQALREEFASTFADVMCREVFIEHCRAQGEPVPNFIRPKGTA